MPTGPHAHLLLQPTACLVVGAAEEQRIKTNVGGQEGGLGGGVAKGVDLPAYARHLAKCLGQEPAGARARRVGFLRNTGGMLPKPPEAFPSPLRAFTYLCTLA